MEKMEKIEIDIKTDMEYLREKYKNLYLEDIVEVNKELDNILLEFNAYEKAPKFILTRALYPNENEQIFEKGKFVVRPAVRYLLDIKDMKTSFILVNNSDFFVSFIDSLIEWIKEYNYYIVLGYNLEVLNKAINEILQAYENSFKISFSLGEGIIDIGNNYIELGLSAEKILSINELGLFSEDAYWREKYIEKFLNVLIECSCPYDIVKIKSDITYELGIYNRKSINKLLRKFVSRRIDYVRVGVGYSEDESSFALIEKIAITPKEVYNFDLDEVMLLDNENPTVQEIKKGLTKIVIQYKLNPFEKKTNIVLDIPLREYLYKTKLDKMEVVK